MFSTTKRTVISIACIVAAIALLCGGTVFAATMVNKSTAIGEENALHFACANAGADPAAVTNVKVEFDFEQGQFVYDVEFDYESVEYSYWIKASDGSIVKKEVELADGTEIVDINNGTSAETGNTGSTGDPDVSTSADPAGDSSASSQTAISLEEAKAVALTDAGLNESAVTFTKAKLDYDDGYQVYEIDFYSNVTEYEYTISTAGAILGKDVERNSAGHPVTSSTTTSTQSTTSTKATTATTNTKADEPATTAPSQSQLSVDEAKAVALANAGLSESQVTVTKAKSDYDDGVQVYEIKFNTTTTKYEYTISTSGAILEKDVDQISTKSTTAATTSTQATTAATASTKATTAATQPATTASSQSQLSLAEAKAVALRDAGLSESQVTMKKAKLDRDDGEDIYEIEFRYNGSDYEYEISASTGAILERDVDHDDDDHDDDD